MSDQKKKQGRKKVPYLVKIDRLKKLIDKEKSRQVIADSFGCDVSTITKHYNGDNPVDLEMLYNYAKYFNVSTDYLLGLTDVSTTNNDLKFVCEYTGLSENSIDFLSNARATDSMDKNLFVFLETLFQYIDADYKLIVKLEDLKKQYELMLIRKIAIVEMQLAKEDGRDERYVLFTHESNGRESCLYLKNDEANMYESFREEQVKHNRGIGNVNLYRDFCKKLNCRDYEAYDFYNETDRLLMYSECAENELAFDASLYRLSKCFESLFDKYLESCTSMSAKKYDIVKKTYDKIVRSQGYLNLSKYTEEYDNAETQN